MKTNPGPPVDELLATSKALLADELLATSKALLDVRAMLAAGYVKRTRELCGISQQAFADVLGCTQAIVSEWETGAKQPGAALGLRLHALMRRLETQLIEDGWMQREGEPVPAVVSL